jgi:hypothetical protein
MASEDPPFVSAEPLGPALASWNRSRLEANGSSAGPRGSAASPARKVLVVRLSGKGAAGFARDLNAAGWEKGAVLDGALPWIPAAIFALE